MNTQRLHLLIADDEEAHIEAIRHAYEGTEIDVEIQTAGTLNDYYTCIQERPPDLALVDLNLPDGRAIDVLTHPPENAPFPILVMTAFGTQQIVVDVMKAGAMDYVIKSPEAFATMPRTVEQTLREWELLQKRMLAEVALRSSEDRYRHLSSIMSDIAYSCTHMNGSGYALDWMTGATEIITGYSIGEIKQRGCWNFLVVEEDVPIFVKNTIELSLGRSGSCELRLRHKDGHVVWVASAAQCLPSDSGQRLYGGITDITERKLREEEHELTARLIVMINTPGNIHERMADLTAALQGWSGCEAVGIRLREGYDFPYFETRGFPARFVQAESHLCAYGPEGQLLRDDKGNPILECMCGNILCGRFDPSKPFFTAHGSFWSNNTTALLASTTESDRQARTRNRCNGEGYESVALIPLRINKTPLGLIQFNDRRTNRFTPDLIAHFERMADTLAIALSRHQAEESLRESEEKFSKAFQTAPYAITLARMKNGQFIDVNDAFTSLSGYTREEALADASVGLKLWVHEKDRQHMVETLRSGKSVQNQEFEFRTKEGKIGTCLFSAQTFQLGPDLCILCSINNIEDRKQMEEALKISESKFRGIISVSPVPMALNDEQQRITFLNPAFVQTFGYTLEDLPTVSQWWTQAYPDPEYRKWVADTWQANLLHAQQTQTAFSPMEVTVRCKDGTPKTILGSAAFFPGPLAGTHLVVLYDITRRKQAEAALRESHQITEGIINTIPVRVFWKDRNLIYLGCNEAFARDAGFENPNDLVGKDDFQLAWRDKADLYRADDRQVIESGDPKLSIEEPLLTSGGTLLSLLTNKIPLRNAQGEITGVLGTYMDITDRKKSEEMMAQQLDELRRWQAVTLGRENRIGELKREVNALAHRLGQPPPYESVEKE